MSNPLILETKGAGCALCDNCAACIMCAPAMNLTGLLGGIAGAGTISNFF